MNALMKKIPLQATTHAGTWLFFAGIIICILKHFIPEVPLTYDFASGLITSGIFGIAYQGKDGSHKERSNKK